MRGQLGSWYRCCGPSTDLTRKQQLAQGILKACMTVRKQRLKFFSSRSHTRKFSVDEWSSNSNSHRCCCGCWIQKSFFFNGQWPNYGNSCGVLFFSQLKHWKFGSICVRTFKHKKFRGGNPDGRGSGNCPCSSLRKPTLPVWTHFLLLLKHILSWCKFEVNLKKNQGENQQSRLYMYTVGVVNASVDLTRPNPTQAGGGGYW